MIFRLGPLSIAITWATPSPKPLPINARTEIASELLDAAAQLQPAAIRLLTMDLPEESRIFLKVVTNPEHLLACRPEDALQAIRHVAYLAVECNLATFT
jgi:hypothetical protein